MSEQQRPAAAAAAAAAAAPQAVPVVIPMLPGQAFFNRHFSTLTLVYTWASRVLGLVFFALAWAKFRGHGWLLDQFGGIEIFSYDKETESPEEAAMHERATVLLLFFLGVQLIVFTLPARTAAAGKPEELLLKKSE